MRLPLLRAEQRCKGAACRAPAQDTGKNAVFCRLALVEQLCNVVYQQVAELLSKLRAHAYIYHRPDSFVVVAAKSRGYFKLVWCHDCHDRVGVYSGDGYEFTYLLW